MGLFSLHIDRELYCRHCNRASYRRPSHDLQFLRTSWAIYKEASDFVYRKAILKFNPCRHPLPRSWLSPEINDRGVELSTDLKDLDDAFAKGFGRIPLSKLKAIRIDLMAPFIDDPGSLLVFWLKITDITELLASCEHKGTTIYIEILERSWRSWRAGKSNNNDDREAAPSNTLARHACGPDFFLARKPDFEVLLTPFKRLRQFEKATVTIPKSLTGAKELASDLELLLEDPDPYGSNTDPFDPLNDFTIQRQFQNIDSELFAERRAFPGQIDVAARENRFRQHVTRSLKDKATFSITNNYIRAIEDDERPVNWSIY